MLAKKFFLRSFRAIFFISCASLQWFISDPRSLQVNYVRGRNSELMMRTNHLTQCSKTVMTPPQKIWGTRAIEGHVLNENLWPNLQLDVIEYEVLLQDLLKTFTFRVFFLLFAKPDEEFYSF